MEHSHRVAILGEQLQIKSDQPPQVIEKIAAYLDLKIKELHNGYVPGDKFKLAILMAMNLAGELFELKAKIEEYEKRTDALSQQAQKLSQSLDRAFEPADKS